MCLGEWRKGPRKKKRAVIFLTSQVMSLDFNYKKIQFEFLSIQSSSMRYNRIREASIVH
jgi:hypothetical protein